MDCTSLTSKFIYCSQYFAYVKGIMARGYGMLQSVVLNKLQAIIEILCLVKDSTNLMIINAGTYFAKLPAIQLNRLPITLYESPLCRDELVHQLGC